MYIRCEGGAVLCHRHYTISFDDWSRRCLAMKFTLRCSGWHRQEKTQKWRVPLTGKSVWNSRWCIKFQGSWWLFARSTLNGLHFSINCPPHIRKMQPIAQILRLSDTARKCDFQIGYVVGRWSGVGCICRPHPRFVWDTFALGVNKVVFWWVE